MSFVLSTVLPSMTFTGNKEMLSDASFRDHIETTYTHKMNLVILGVSICFANQLELERVFACKV